LLRPALIGAEYSASCPGLFIPEEIYHGAHWIEFWVGPTAILSVENEKENFVSDVIPTPDHALCKLNI
jgi:hypothetical protein